MAKKYKNTVHKNPFREDRPKKGSPAVVVTIIALSFVVIILGSVFIHNYYGVIHLTTTSVGNNVYDKRNKITYELAPMCYQPVKLIEKNDPYALYGKTKFYKLDGIDPKKMISTSEDGIYDLYYSSDFKLPSLLELNPDMAMVCEVDIAAIAVDTLTKEEAALAIETITEKEKSDYPDDIDPDSVLYIYFSSEEYPYLYYYITYFRTESGNRYLFDRSQGNCVCLGDVLSDALN